MPGKPTELVFPLKGISDGWAFGRQPEGTTPDAQNVVPFDTLSTRVRGGQRWGTSKYYSSLHNGAEIIQRMTTVTKMLNPGDTSTDNFTQANGVLSDTNWYLLSQSGDNFVTSVTEPLVVDNAIQQGHDGSTYLTGAIYKSLASYSISYEITAEITLTSDGSSGNSEVHFFVRSAAAPTVHRNTGMVRSWIVLNNNPGAAPPWLDLYIQTKNDDYEYTYFVMTPGSNDYLDPAWWATARTLKLVVDGDVFTLYVENTQLHQATVSRLRSNTGVGFLLGAYSGSSVATVDDFTLTNTPSQTGRAHKLIAVSGGDVFAGVLPEGLTAATNGTNAVATSGLIDMQTAFDRVYFADGNPANYKYFDNNDDTVYTCTPTAGTLPMGTDQTAVSITAVDTGNKRFTVAEDWSARAAGDYFLVAGSTGNDGYYTLVSLTGTGPTVLTVTETIADATVDGTIQYQNKACKIIKLYRGRIIMAGLTTDPHNWFMSAAGDALDWDYGATISATMAVAGNNTTAGYCPDIITCLAPYSDDLMFMGGDHTLWIMRGDPASKGRIDNVSYQTGISGPDAYTFDPNGIFYFFGMGTIWRMSAGGVPEPLSRNRMDVAFGAINLTTDTVHLAWDNKRHGLFIFIVPSSEGSTTHYYWDERTDSFWKIIFPDAQGPTTVYAYDGDNPDDSALLLGGWDGYIRQVDSSVTDDDGTAISSYILYPPISAGGPTRNTRITSITAVLDTDSNDVILTTYAEDTVQKTVESSTIRFARTISAGRTKILNRIAGNAIMIKLSNSVDETTWAIESLIADIEVIGHTRKNQL